MAVPPNYFITGVWFSEQNGKKQITHVLLHHNGDKGFGPGAKTAESVVVGLLNSRSTVMTLRWNQLTAVWQRGAYIEVVQDGIRGQYLRSHKDASREDNLDNMINMQGFVQGV